MNIASGCEPTPKSSLPQKIGWLGIAATDFASYMWAQTFRRRSDNAVERRQYRTLKRVIDHAWRHVPFYRRYWSEACFDPSQFQSLDDIRRIPVIDKNTVRANLHDMLADNTSLRRMSPIKTGGTTGMPMEFYIDNYKARAKEMAHLIYMERHACGYRRGWDNCLTLRGARIPEELLQKNIFWVKSDRERGIVMSSFHLLDENYQIYIDKIRSERPRFIRAYPSSIVALCLLMKRHGEAPLKGLRGVLCSSESVYHWQRKLVKEVLGVNIFGMYGHSEKAVCAYQCRDNYLFPPLYGYTEFVDDQLRPVTVPGEKAQIIATGFGMDAFPFIRYRTDDIAVVGAPQKAYPQVAQEIVGRKQEFLIDRDSNHVPFTCSDEVFWAVPQVEAYQYVQHTPGRLEIRVLSRTAESDELSDRIRKNAAQMFVNFDIDIIFVEDLPRTKTGKFCYLVQNIKE